MTLPITGLQGPHGSDAAKQSAPIDPQALKAAKEFEAIFLRTLLSSLEKTTSVSGGSRLDAGQSTYGGMVVGALADNISGSGGIGLAEIVAKSLSAQQSAAPAEPKPPK